MALPPYALTTLADAKAFLGVDDDDRDAQIEALVGQASRLTLRKTEREFAPASNAGVTRRVAYRGGTLLDLAPYEARAVTAVTFGPTDAAPTVLAAGDWMLWPVPAPDGVYDQLRLGREYSTGSFGVTLVDVVGSWGWAAPPLDIVWCVHRLVDLGFRADIALVSDTNEVLYEQLPLDVVDVWSSYRRFVMGAV